MAVARSITDVANKEPKSRDDWDSGTRSDTEGEDGMEVKDYGHRTAYSAKPTSTTPEVAPKNQLHGERTRFRSTPSRNATSETGSMLIRSWKRTQDTRRNKH
jgi:hypothetical protein